ncbi:LysR family transcriptional regulator [Streptomyces sp. NPDC054887]
MELRHLEYFVAVAEECHFTRAAQRLMVSQSGLSASVRELERELGTALFARTTRSVGLTDAGRALLAEARRTLAAARAAKDAVAAVQGLLRGTLTVGTEQCIAGVHVPGLLARFHQRHPQVEIRLRQAGSAQLIEEVGSGRLDLAFAIDCGDTPRTVRTLPLTDEPMLLLCHPDHALGDAGEVSWHELRDEPFIDFHSDWGPRRVGDAAFAAAGVGRQVSLEVNDVHSLLELVRESLGVALVPQHFTRKPEAAGLRAVPLAGARRLTYSSVTALPHEEGTSPAARGLLGLLRPAAV